MSETTPMATFSEREQLFMVPGPAGAIEVATWAPAATGPIAESSRVAVVCHPHPLHGGAMQNKVVTTVARAYRDLGVPVVRFNFRGVGRSEGEFDNAVGEVDDLLAVIKWLQSSPTEAKLLLAGFSFGSSVAAQASHRLTGLIEHLLLLAPPVERYRFDVEGRFPCPVLTVIGDQDELVDVPGVYRWEQELQSPHQMINYPEASHFFHGTLGPLKADVSEQLLQALR